MQECTMQVDRVVSPDGFVVRGEPLRHAVMALDTQCGRQFPVRT